MTEHKKTVGRTAPIDRVLDKLEGVTASGDGYMALCPAHDDTNPSLSIKETDTGKVLLHCFAGCKLDRILGKLDLTVEDLSAPLYPKNDANLQTPPVTTSKTNKLEFASGVQTQCKPGCNLQGYARKKRLPVKFLESLGLKTDDSGKTPELHIPYLDTNGDEVAVRRRISLDGTDRFRWRKGDKTIPYGLWRLEKYKGNTIFLVEGESDAQTLWFKKIPALGIPGVATWKNEWAAYLEPFSRIYYALEPDSGGDQLLQRLLGSPLADRIKVLRMDQLGVKDMSELYTLNPKGFKSNLRRLAKAALPIAETLREIAREDSWELCEGIANETDILGQLIDLLRERGVAGETRAVKLVYLALVSRLLDRPVSLALKAPSSTGKSWVVHKVLEFFPKQAYHLLTGMSEKALVYSSEPVKHRTLVLVEAEGLQEGFLAYAVRSLLSEGRLRYQVTEGEGRKRYTRVVELEGPTNLIVTTTLAALDAELETRIFSCHLDEKPGQTRAVLEMQARLASTHESDDLEDWKAFQTWLQVGESRVVVPYALRLARGIKTVAVRLRRDFTTLVGLIKAHAIIHQLHRRRNKEGAIVATLADYAAIRDLVDNLISEGVETSVNDSIREVVAAVGELFQEEIDKAANHPDLRTAEPVTVAKVTRRLKIENSTVWRRIQQAIKLGYLRNDQKHKGMPAELYPNEPLPIKKSVLPKPAELKKRPKRSKSQKS